MSEDQSGNGSGKATWVEKIGRAFTHQPRNREELVHILRAACLQGILDSDALAMMGEAAVAALVDMLSDARPHTRLLAIRALERIQSPQAIGPLFEMLDDPSYLVQFHAREALEALGAGMVFFAPS